MTRSHRHDSGVTIVEASFALPIMFLFIFGLIDLGLWTLNSNQAANAARDGARAGILSYELADAGTGPDHDKVLAAVKQHLSGQELDASSITVDCVNPDGSVISCALAEPGDDRIRVDVRWDWTLLTPIAGSLGIDKGAAEGSATMVIVGRPLGSAVADGAYADDPVASTPPASETCTVGTPVVTPSPVESQGNQLKGGLTVTFSSSATCADLKVELVAGADSDPDAARLLFACACGEGPDHTWSYTGSDNVWKKSTTGTVNILDGTTLMASRTFSIS